MQKILKKIFGTKFEKDIRDLRPLVERINALEAEYQALSEEEFKAKTEEFRQRINGGETEDDRMCEAFAVVKNGCRRLCGSNVDVCGHEMKWDMVPFDVQLMGGIVLHQGKIAEMATGEGKT
ncbi:MAG: preprotein translocase subunit SecA, partial [Verrucomicrobiota bacterium]